MRIPALDLIGQYHLKLFALEDYFSQLADLGSLQPSGTFEKQKSLTANSLDILRHFRLEFEALRQKHREPIRSTIAGYRPFIELTEMEVALVEGISEMHAQVWENRRLRHVASQA